MDSFILRFLKYSGYLISGLILLQLFSVIIFKFNLKDAIESDFVSFYTGARMVSSGEGMNLYDVNSQREFQNDTISDYIQTDLLLAFKNPPFVGVLLYPFSKLSLALGYKIFTFALAILLLFFTVISSVVFPEIKKILFWTLLPFFYLPNLMSIDLAQLSLIVLVIVLFLYKYIFENNYYMAGIFTGLLLIKPQYLLIFPFLLLMIKNKKKYLLGVIVSIGILIFISMIISGPFFFTKYFNFLINTENASFGSRSRSMFTLYSLIKKIELTKNLELGAILGINAIFYTVSIRLFSKYLKNIPHELAFSNALILTVIFSIHSLVHDLALIFIAVLIFVKFIIKKKKKTSKTLLFVSILGIWSVPYLRYTNFIYLSSLVFLLIILLSSKAVYTKSHINAK